MSTRGSSAVSTAVSSVSTRHSGQQQQEYSNHPGMSYMSGGTAGQRPASMKGGGAKKHGYPSADQDYRCVCVVVHYVCNFNSCCYNYKM